MKKILVFDKDLQTLGTIVQLISHLGYSAIGAGTYDSAIRTVRMQTTRPDIAIVSTHDLTFEESMNTIVEMNIAHPEMSIVLAHTGLFTSELRDSARLAGVNMLIAKPFTVEELKVVLKPLI